MSRSAIQLRAWAKVFNTACAPRPAHAAAPAAPPGAQPGPAHSGEPPQRRAGGLAARQLKHGAAPALGGQLHGGFKPRNATVLDDQESRIIIKNGQSTARPAAGKPDCREIIRARLAKPPADRNITSKPLPEG